MDSPTQRWQCVNGCNTFECLGTPTYCPFCGTAEVYATNTDSDSQ